ncbi:hypothetical protein BCR32DRAFT_270525 [Anaeromyces robustus]|uniref:BTB domain-containing protein n=1 Tax=Anaeromyces robustus TaxID=1754192 RepID=A0A1Y1WWH9_9FUNG|nr:hypothetical protein BCR32DRAFT_270525 [Anaeromyces robustus]|eukprot:ORX77668.1 hypothetical protein BCR32DRAFT_270525 [Anaeromyces robustus]
MVDQNNIDNDKNINKGDNGNIRNDSYDYNIDDNDNNNNNYENNDMQNNLDDIESENEQSLNSEENIFYRDRTLLDIINYIFNIDETDSENGDTVCSTNESENVDNEDQIIEDENNNENEYEYENENNENDDVGISMNNLSKYKSTSKLVLNQLNKKKLVDFQHIQGTLRQQAYNLHKYKNGISPKNISDFENNNNNISTSNKKDLNGSLDYIINILKENKDKDKKHSVYSSKLSTAHLHIDEEYKKYFKHRAIPTLPLTFSPTKNSNKYTYSFYYNTGIQSYYENDPPSVVKGNWTEGILNLHLNIHKNLKYEYILWDPYEIPFSLELEWCFDFRPTNMLLESLQLTVMQNDPNSKILDKSMAHIEAITWYVHAGLTSDIINYSYISNIKKQDYIMLEPDAPTSSLPQKENNENIKNTSFDPYENDIHFNGVPVVDFDLNRNNSFLWQRIPEQKVYFFNESTTNEKVINSKFQLTRDGTSFNQVNLSTSAFKQSGFIIKAVIKGEFHSEYFEGHGGSVINLFGGGDRFQIKEYYEKKYRLFDFNCTLKPAFDVDTKILKSVKQHIDEIDSSTTLDPKQFNDEKIILSNKEKQDFTIALLKLDESRKEDKFLLRIRKKCKIKDDSYLIDCFNDTQNNIIKFYLSKESLIKNNHYISRIFGSSNSLASQKQTSSNEIVLKNVDHISLYQIIFYFSKGYFPDQHLYNMYDWIGILTVSSKFQFNNIFKYCEYQLKSFITKETIHEIYGYAIKNKALQLTMKSPKKSEDVIINIKSELNETKKEKSRSKFKLDKYNFIMYMKQLFYHIVNLDLSIITFIFLLVYMNLTLIIGLPIAIFFGYLRFIIFATTAFVSFIEVISDISSYNTWREKLFKIFCTPYVILYILVTILAIIIFALGNGIVFFTFIIIIGLCSLCQSIIWPIVDSTKTFIILSNVINGYCNGMRYAKKNKDSNSIDAPYDLDGNNSIFGSTSSIFKKDCKNTISTNNSKILRSSAFINYDNMDALMKYMNDYFNHESNISKASSFTLVIQDFINGTKIIVPINYRENETSLIKIMLDIWLSCMKSSIILCGRWWRILCFHPFGIFSILYPGFTENYYIYEGYRFFWWHKKSLIEHPHFC